MSNPAALLGRMGTEKCPLNLATMRSLLILAREASRGMKSDSQLAGDWAESEWEGRSGASRASPHRKSSRSAVKGSIRVVPASASGDSFV